MARRIIFTSLLVILLLTACGGQATPAEPTPDVAAVRTSAASTVVSQFTLTAAVFTPTISAALPTEPAVVEDVATATPEAVAQEATASTPGTEIPCDLLSYDPVNVDVNVPDNTVMAPGQEFIKTWRVKNVGSCPWGAGYVLAYAGYDDDMDGQFIALTEVVQAGQEVEISIQFKAPQQAGIYVSAWSMRNASGFFFPERIFVKIVVQ